MFDKQLIKFKEAYKEYNNGKMIDDIYFKHWIVSDIFYSINKYILVFGIIFIIISLCLCCAIDSLIMLYISIYGTGILFMLWCITFGVALWFDDDDPNGPIDRP